VGKDAAQVVADEQVGQEGSLRLGDTSALGQRAYQDA
jgi:hypothetical protein